MQPHIMMIGTDGKPDYLLFARKGMIGLGVKPNLIAEGKAKGTTYIGLRLRSAPLPEGAIPDDGVVNFQHMKLGLQDAWPEVEWEKADAERASTSIGMLVKGTPKTAAKELLTALGPDKLPQQITDYLITLCGEEHLTMPKEVIRQWLQDFYKPIVDKLKGIIALEQSYMGQLEGSVGSFAMSAKLLKAAHNSVEKGATPHDVPDVEDKEDPGEDA